jgi:dihydrofolate synthase / folylpolyglutamate synthase
VGWSGRGRRYTGMAYPALRGANQLLNAAGAIAALEALRERLPITAQAVRTGLALVELPGRFQIVPGQPTLVLDVAHNPQSVAALALNLDAMGFFPRTHAVFGAMADKDLAGAAGACAAGGPLALLRPAHARAATPAAALAALPRRRRHRPWEVSQPRERPAEALRAAAAAADPADRIVVFGSFYTVGGVLKEGLPRPRTSADVADATGGPPPRTPDSMPTWPCPAVPSDPPSRRAARRPAARHDRAAGPHRGRAAG